MCGIAGVFSAEPEVASSAVARMVTAMAHRGPDGEGTYSARIGEAGLCLGHRRLAIRDLSEAGHQPMVHRKPGTCSSTTARSTAPTSYGGSSPGSEAPPRSLRRRGAAPRAGTWGAAALGRLNGMYALGFFEQARTSLLLARDPMGMKPLTGSRRGPRCCSRASARRRPVGLVPPKISAAALGGLLAFGAPQEPLTILESVRTFPAGTWARFRLEPSGRAREEERARFWSIPASIPRCPRRTPSRSCGRRWTLPCAITW
jgi:asparagine synthase (glutamine-hydrolysing)